MRDGGRDAKSQDSIASRFKTGSGVIALAQGRC